MGEHLVLPSFGITEVRNTTSGALEWTRPTTCINVNDVFGAQDFSEKRLDFLNVTLYAAATGAKVWTRRFSTERIMERRFISSGDAFILYRRFVSNASFVAITSSGQSAALTIESADGDLVAASPSLYILASPPASSGRYYAVIYAIGRLDGVLRWRTAFPTENGTVLSMDTFGQYMLLMTTIGVTCIDLEDGTLLWNYQTNAWPLGINCDDSLVLLVGQLNTQWTCTMLDQQSGNQLWNYTSKLQLVSTACVVSGKLVIVIGRIANLTSVEMIDALDGSFVDSFPIPFDGLGPYFACSGNTLYVGTFYTLYGDIAKYVITSV